MEETTTWLKAKYTNKKTKGKFKSAGTGSAKRSMRKKNPKAPKPDFQMVMNLYGPTCNKTRWIRVPITK